MTDVARNIGWRERSEAEKTAYREGMAAGALLVGVAAIVLGLVL